MAAGHPNIFCSVHYIAKEVTEDSTININRLALVGSTIGALGFFFLPLIELKPNRIASGISFNLLEFNQDLRFLMLFLLVLLVFSLAFRRDEQSRGWLLALVGNVIILLTLILPAMAGEQLLASAPDLFGENVRLNPRILPSAAMAVALLAGYVIIYAGIGDLRRSGASRLALVGFSWFWLPVAAVLFSQGNFDVYSIVVEFDTNGELLGQRFIEHLTFVSISIITGSVIGISLGLWASRDERLAPVILYAVGIIQTIPSLALFGLLLLPLARFGDQLFTDVLVIFVATLVIALVIGVIFVRFQNYFPDALRPVGLIATAIASSIPLALATIIVVSFLFRITLLALTNDRFAGMRELVAVLLIAAFVLWLLFRKKGPLIKRIPRRARPYMRYAGIALAAVGSVVFVVLLVQSAQFFLRNVAGIDTLTIRNLGVSGIGVAPALIALTLYSLLPLVRNTYAGLNNVDPAIIDSGRGMGMTPVQIFFRIELPLAVPVIIAGVRNAGVALVGIGTIASVIGGGGLGDFVLQGIINTSIDLILLGAIPAIILALILDGGLRGIEQIITSPGIRQ